MGWPVLRHCDLLYKIFIFPNLFYCTCGFLEWLSVVPDLGILHMFICVRVGYRNRDICTTLIIHMVLTYVLFGGHFGYFRITGDIRFVRNRLIFWFISRYRDGSLLLYPNKIRMPAMTLINFPFHIIILPMLMLIGHIIGIADISRFVGFGRFVIVGHVHVGNTLLLLVYCVDICCFVFLFVYFVIFDLYC